MTDQKALEAAFAAWINNPKPDATVKELIAGAIAIVYFLTTYTILGR